MPREVDLTRPCDGCGEPIGGGFMHCPKCNIWFCFYCPYGPDYKDFKLQSDKMPHV